MADHHGAAGAVAALLDDVRADLPAEAEQLDLLAASQRPVGELIRWDDARVAAEAERTRKAGRPKGAQNLATRELKQWIVQLLGGTPQERLARWAAMEPEELARRLGCTVQEAWKEQRRIEIELMPYFMARMQPVDDQGRPVPLVALSIGGQVGQANGAEPWSVWQNRRAEPIDITPEGEAE